MILERKDHIINDFSTLAQFFQIAKDKIGIYPKILKMIFDRVDIKIEKDAAFLMFIGAGRSGSTLVSSIINSHENVLISNELDFCRYYTPILGKKTLLNLIKYQDKIFSSKGRKWTGYSYDIKTHSSKKKIKVIGDKKSGITSIRLSERPMLLKKIATKLKMPVKFINHSRNPFDVITTMANRHDFSIQDASNHYFRRIEGVITIQKMLSEKQYLNTYHESLVEMPEKEIIKICSFLNLSPTEQYITNCKNVIFKKTKKSRNSIQWEQEDIKRVKKKIEHIQFLSHYVFN